MRFVFTGIRLMSTIRRLKYNKNPEVRGNAALALVDFRDSRAVEPLINALDDKERTVRYWAAFALGRLGDGRAVEPLIKALSGGTGSAAFALGRLGDSRAVGPLIKALGDKEWGMRENAAFGLGQLGDQSAVEPLLKAMSDKDSSVRKATAHALGQLGDSRAVEPLITDLCDSNRDVRKAAAEALSRLGEIKWPRIIEGNNGDFGRLKECGEKRFIEPLIKALSHEDRDARAAAVYALGQLGDNRAVQPLIMVLCDSNREVRKGAAEALSNLGEARWLKIIEGDGEDLARLGECGDKRVVEPLIKALGIGKSDVRAVAAGALGMLGHGRAVDVSSKLWVMRLMMSVRLQQML